MNFNIVIGVPAVEKVTMLVCNGYFPAEIVTHHLACDVINAYAVMIESG